MLKPIEKRLILIHVVLFLICAVCRIYCQGHMEDWYYRFQMGDLYWSTLLFAKPLFYYASCFLGTFFLARYAFRDDLYLPYKQFGIVAMALLVMYILLAGVSLCIVLFGTPVRFLVSVYSVCMPAILNYYGMLCIPGILFGLVAENRWKE